MNKTDKSCCDEYIVDSRRNIRKKHIDYNNIQSINDGVNNCITNIFLSKKNEAINMSKNIKKTNNNENDFDFNIDYKEGF